MNIPITYATTLLSFLLSFAVVLSGFHASQLLGVVIGRADQVHSTSDDVGHAKTSLDLHHHADKQPVHNLLKSAGDLQLYADSRSLRGVHDRRRDALGYSFITRWLVEWWQMSAARF